MITVNKLREFFIFIILEFLRNTPVEGKPEPWLIMPIPSSQAESRSSQSSLPS